MFLPTTSAELKKLKWDKLDVILVTGDTYIDSPASGVSIIGQLLLAAGFRTGIIAQPDLRSPSDIGRLGTPDLFWGITAGAMDSMVANYTAVKKKRHADDLTAGGKNNRRPDRACVVYANLIRQYFKNTKPLVLGGLEASLRRIAHYDYWDDSIRRSLLFDARADVIVYGMAEKAVIELARKMRNGLDIKDTRGICYIDSKPNLDYLELPSLENVIADKREFVRMFDLFYRNNDPLTACGLFQRHGSRYLIHNPPQPPLTASELDNIYALNFAREVHPFYREQGEVRAMDTIKFSITSHRGCFGECNFCSIGIHEGRTVVARSEESIKAEARKLTARPDFKGYILDVGGPTANMYGIDCPRRQAHGSCNKKRCLSPRVCPNLRVDHRRQINLMRQIRKINGIKKVFVASGIRYDLLMADKQHCLSYLQELVKHHISGQLKIAPEHSTESVLRLMGKPGNSALLKFRDIFEKLNKNSASRKFLTYYFIAAHPGCTEGDMHSLKEFTSRELRINPEQVQIFTPTPSTYSSLMYWTEIDPATGRKIFVEKDINKKQRQKNIVAAAGEKEKAHRKSRRIT
ncbi:MAG TPA: YgiQ family radical SAM protein [Smithellaceae bacterium]|nr:YgiQ family radical SAM protein [Smithellaceae bacterium]